VFGTSLRNLVDHPPLYGWNWDLEINGGGGLGDIPAQPAAKLLNADPDVAEWSGYYFSTVQVNGLSVPVLGSDADADVAPPMLSGHALLSTTQIVLGAGTLAQLHTHIGQDVSVAAPGAKAVQLRVVGTATLPAIGIAGATHLEMGTGAVVPYQVIPAVARNIFASPDPGPNAIFVRLRAGVSPAAGMRSLSAIVSALSGLPSNGGDVMADQRPAEIINYRELGTTPAALGAALGVGALAGLALTLIATVRRRRREFAVMKALGCTPRQLAAIVAWQASVAVGIGLCIGVPVGIAAGRASWDAFAAGIHAVPQITVPAGTLTAVAAGALVLAVLIAAIPGRLAAATPTGELLRAE
jgi:putative ABC transport system permease protein